MPIYVFSCEKGHTLERVRTKPYERRMRFRCKECGLYMHRDVQAEHGMKKRALHLDYNNDPISHLSGKRSFKGIMVEHLTPEPVFIKSKHQYLKLLKETNSREKLA